MGSQKKKLILLPFQMIADLKNKVIEKDKEIEQLKQMLKDRDSTILRMQRHIDRVPDIETLNLISESL